MKHLITVLLLIPFSIMARSVWRPIDPKKPKITASWVGDGQTFSLSNDCLEEYSLFQIFDKEFFERKLLPDESITYRYDATKKVSSLILKDLINELLLEIEQGKTEFTHFTILQSKDFNFSKPTGLIVLKYNDYPFVLKLFIETPATFVDPFDKGMEPCFSFFLGGGINRHILGFTRLKNKEIISYRLTQSPWKDTISLPRKWHYLPKQSKWIHLVGENIGKKSKLIIDFPGTYCIIADAIEPVRVLSLFNENDKKRALNLCNYLNLWIDPHMTNFMIEKYTDKLVIVDTEHFPSFTGLREPIQFSSYTGWYLYLAGKCWINTFMTTKNNRRNTKKHSIQMNLVEMYKELEKKGVLAHSA